MNNDTTNRTVGTSDTDTDANRDPLTGAPGAHPVGTATGAVAGGIAAGAAAGTVAGPVGTAIGAAVGAVVGGLAGKASPSRSIRPAKTPTGATTTRRVRTSAVAATTT